MHPRIGAGKAVGWDKVEFLMVGLRKPGQPEFNVNMELK
jgi:hypothetical protein